MLRSNGWSDIKPNYYNAMEGIFHSPHSEHPPRPASVRTGCISVVAGQRKLHRTGLPRLTRKNVSLEQEELIDILKNILDHKNFCGKSRKSRRGEGDSTWLSSTIMARGMHDPREWGISRKEDYNNVSSGINWLDGQARKPL